MALFVIGILIIRLIALSFSDVFFCEAAEVIKPNLWIQFVNPHFISFLNNPWCLETPFAFKPTYLNMDSDLENVQVCDLIMPRRIL